MSVFYPPYEIVTGDEIEQGDILPNCGVPEVSPALAMHAEQGMRISVDITSYDVIVLTQSCDLAKGREKVEEVVFCPLFSLHELGMGKSQKEQCRKGQLPAYNLLLPNELPDWTQGFRVVEFRRIFSLPLATVRQICMERGARERLLPPYREHMSQAFARFYMRVGLPVDVPPFK